MPLRAPAEPGVRRLPGANAVSFRYKEWRETMIADVPETADWVLDSFYDDLPYAAMGDLAVFVSRDILASSAPDLCLDRVVAFWSRMAASRDPEVHNLLVPAALEVVTDSRRVIEILRPRMSERLRNLLDYTILTHYGREARDWSQVDIDAAPNVALLSDALGRVPP